MSSSDQNNTKNMLQNSSLPLKSKHKYISAYECFMAWKRKRNEQSLDEEIFLTYFKELAEIQKPSSLWAQYSMLKATMQDKHNVNLKNHEKLLSFLKKYTVGSKSEKSEVLTEENILKFINEAPDEIYLATKVALIIGVDGACKLFELTDLTINDIKTNGELMVVKIRSEFKRDRIFVVREEFVPVVKKYQALRPKNMPTNRFFVNYRYGKCTRQFIGRNKFSVLPKQIASYLKLPNPERYSGHCFKRSSVASRATLIKGERKDSSHQVAENSTGNESPINKINRKEENSLVHDKVFEEVDIKVEDLNDFGEEILLREDLFPPIEFNDLPDTLQPLISGRESRSSVMQDFSIYTSEDCVPIETETVNQMIKSSSPRNNESQTENETHETISVAGNNIRISFKNCAHVGNITVNIMNK